MSKGSKRRPSSVPKKQVDENWDTIFGKKERKKPDPANALVELMVRHVRGDHIFEA